MVAHPVTTPSAGQLFVGHAEVSGAMLGKETDFLEAALVDQHGHAFPRGELAGGMVLVNALFAAAEFEFGALVAKVGNLVGHRGFFYGLCLFGHPCSWFVQGLVQSLLQSEHESSFVVMKPRQPGGSDGPTIGHAAPRRSSSFAAASCCLARVSGALDGKHVAGFLGFGLISCRGEPQPGGR